MKRFSRSLILLAVFLVGGMLPVFSQSSLVVRKPTGDDYWYILKEAQDAYDFGDYGKCVALAEQAKTKRKDQIKWEQYTLDQSQRLVLIRSAGDELKNVTRAMEDAKQKNALSIVNHYLETYGSEKFKGSFSSLLKFINQNNSYPEADYLIGRVYKLEGEPTLAAVYMKRAYEASDLLSVPEVRYDILYDMADMAEHNDEYEKYLMDILADDSMYTRATFMNSMEKVIAGKDSASVERFFMLYRNQSAHSLEALRRLSLYYQELAMSAQDDNTARSFMSKSLKCCALGTIVAVTRIQEVLEDRQTEYKYTSLSDLFRIASIYPDIVNWGNEKTVWEMFYNLADTAQKMGYTAFSSELFSVLSKSIPETYWQDKAALRVK
ncbi:MAG: hypothetical protein J6Y60_01285 [Treponema sp.]|nr:hypothetical protein [Treponema sp.]